jgi:hypothetical protein
VVNSMKVIARLAKPDLGIVRVIQLASADHSGWRSLDFMLDVFGDGALRM